MIGAGLALRARPPAWWPANAVFAADFAGRRFMRGGSAVPQSEALAFARASPAWSRTAAGEVVAFADNAPRLTDLGLAVEEARTRLTPAPTEIGGSAWTTEATPALTVLPADGLFPAPLRIASDGQVFARRNVALALTSGQAVHLKARYRAGTSPNAGLYMRTNAANIQSILQGPHGALVSTTAAGGPWSNISSVALGGGLFEIDVDFTPGSTQTDWRLGISPRSTVAGEYLDVLGAMVLDGAGGGEWILGASAAATATAADAAVLAIPAGQRDVTLNFDDQSSLALPAQAVGAQGWSLPARLPRRFVRSVLAT